MIPPLPEDIVSEQDLLDELNRQVEAELRGSLQGWELDDLLEEPVWDPDEADLALFEADPPAWAMATAGPELAAALAGIHWGPVVGDAALSGAALIEAVKAAARMQAWSEAMKVAATAAFWRRRQAEAAGRAADGDERYQEDTGTVTVSSTGPKVDPMRGASAELAAALRLAPRTVVGHIDDAVRMTRDLPDVFAAMFRGELSMSKARVITDATEDLPLEAQRAVQDQVLPKAPDQTQGQLQAACRRAAAAVSDPDDVEKKHQKAKAGRKVTKTVLPDGMAGLWWTDTAEAIETAWIAINAMADAAKTPGDTRVADQRRADVAGDVFRSFLDKGIDWLGRALPTQQRRRPHIEVLVPITALLGIRDDVCELVGYGPIPTSMALQLACEGAWRRLLTDPATGVVLEASTTRHDPPAQVSQTVMARDRTCRFMGCGQPAHRCDRDHGQKHRYTGQTRL
ncbi:MAG: DUF222 domain-containing protein, partial [Nocardioidaceae bacterium]